MQILTGLFDITGFMPHGYCLTWDSALLWLTVLSDTVMTLAYATYPIGIAYFVWKRKDLHYRWLYLGFFITFIVTCASTHLMAIVTIWLPLYWLDAYVKAVSALVALATVFAIWWVIPRALKLPSPEELKKALDAAEAANKAKSVFLANMSHELRTPLNAILGFSTIMQKDENCPDSQKRNLEIINLSGEHLLTLINDVLEMAKIDAGRLQLDEMAFDLGNMVRDVSDMMSVRAVDKGLQLLLDQSSQCPHFIKADEARLRQVLINLLGNAIKFTQQGSITLRLGTTTDEHRLLIEVEDTGAGIAKEDQHRIFEPFVQLGEQGDSKGTGLGLTISRQFIQLMGGQLSLESTLGKGSLFCVDLPLQPVSAQDIVQQPQDIYHGRVAGVVAGQTEYRILIVEDQLENQLLLAQLMTDIGMQVKVAKNGKVGVELFQTWQPQLIWMDRRMPIMDGVEATRAIRQLPKGQTVKIIAVTASAFIEQREEMLDAGMDDFLRKPYRPDEIYACLAKHLGMQYIYDEHQCLPKTLSAEMFVNIPPNLLADFKEALESLDTDSIDDLIQDIATHDAQLACNLRHLAKQFEFSVILKVLDSSVFNPMECHALRDYHAKRDTPDLNP